MEREFDIIVYGATGFTGKLVAEYLGGAADDGLRWAIAGRSEDKLRQLHGELGLADSVACIVADAGNPQTLADMAARTNVVLTTVGPYQLYGTPLVDACVKAGTDYTDLCGEPAWMYDVISEYDAAAKDSGSRIVLSCGFDSIPFDLGVQTLQNAAIARSGSPIARVKGRVAKMKGTFSGGTAASFAQTMVRAGQDRDVIARLKDPFSLVPGFEGPSQPPGHKPVYDEDLGSWSAPFIMASINTKNIHRSNALLGHAYGEDFIYDEMVLTGPGDEGEARANHVAQDRSMAENPPKPGEGPSREEREAGLYDVIFTGETVSGERLTARVTGDKDPGYGSTSKMIAETARLLAETRGDAGRKSGVLTSASALGTSLAERLAERAGLTFDVAG